MAYYNKGANAERELIHILFKNGLSVVRTAGSGATSLPAPDVIALDKKNKLAFECKAWNAAYLSIPIEQMEELQKWARRAGTKVFVAWKIPKKGWHFLRPKDFTKRRKHFMISRKKALTHSINLNVIIGRQTILLKK